MFRMTSGARYSGVPHSVYVSPAESARIAAAYGGVLTVFDLLREAKVDQLQVSLCINEDVLWLQVAVCDALSLVEEL